MPKSVCNFFNQKKNSMAKEKTIQFSFFFDGMTDI